MKIKNKLLIAISVFILLAILSVTALCLYRDRNAKPLTLLRKLLPIQLRFIKKMIYGKMIF